MDVAALIISIVSLLVSFAVVFIEVYNNKKINDINLEAELSKDIIKKYVTEEIPKAILKIYFEKQKLTNIKPLQDALNGLRNSLRFFKYCDNIFYSKLKEKTQSLEDYIVKNEGKTFETEDQGEVVNKIHSQTADIFQLLKTKYKNG